MIAALFAQLPELTLAFTPHAATAADDRAHYCARVPSARLRTLKQVSMFASSEDHRNVLITGAHQSLGFTTAAILASRGDRLIVHADSLEGGESALENLIKGGVDPLHVELITADYLDLHDVARCARELTARHRRIDVLINAAMTTPTDRRAFTKDGIERTFQYNYLAPYLLTGILSEVVTASHARIVNVSSTLHVGASIAWNDLNRNDHYAPRPVYAQAALATVLLTSTLAELWGDTCCAVSVDPGSTDPNVLRLHGPSLQADDNASLVLAQLASPDCSLDNGLFHDRLAAQSLGPHVTPRSFRRLWSRSAELTGLRP